MHGFNKRGPKTKFTHEHAAHLRVFVRQRLSDLRHDVAMLNRNFRIFKQHLAGQPVFVR